MNYERISLLTLEIVNKKKEIADWISTYNLNSDYVYHPCDNRFFPEFFKNLAVQKLHDLEDELSREFQKAKK